MFLVNAVVVVIGGMKIRFRDWSWVKVINKLYISLMISNESLVLGSGQIEFSFHVILFSGLPTTGACDDKYFASRTNMFYLQYVIVLPPIHLIAATMLQNERYSLWLFYVFVWTQVFGIVHKTGTSDFGNTLLFVQWPLTDQGWLYYSAIHTFPMLNVGEQRQTLLWPILDRYSIVDLSTRDIYFYINIVTRKCHGGHRE